MLYIIDAVLIDDEGKPVKIHEEFTLRQEFDKRYTALVLNYDEPIKVTIK